MTTQEAINYWKKGIDEDIKDLSEEYPQYKDRLIQKVENAMVSAINALEKQMPKKVLNRKLLRDFNNKLYAFRGDCPTCGCERIMSKDTNYCYCCGQKLDWDE